MALHLNDELEPGVVEKLIHEFGSALEQTTGLDVTTHVDRRDGKVTARYEVRLELRDTLTIDIDAIAVKHAGDPAAFIAEWVEHHMKPFGDKTAKAALAAADDWQQMTRDAN